MTHMCSTKCCKENKGMCKHEKTTLMILVVIVAAALYFVLI
ncbi:MAG: hypothetical protein QF824_04875 [Candidatus Woesearchaeota archaeon]|nr:hypothetical protein [Candidatus Woesearchaeota archaeon]